MTVGRFADEAHVVVVDPAVDRLIATLTGPLPKVARTRQTGMSCDIISLLRADDGDERTRP